MPKRNIRAAKVCVDRISNLPDDVISQILFRLPTNDAVRTSVLSQQWRYMYTPIYDVDIRIDDLYKPLHDQDRISSLDSFVKKVLTHDYPKKISLFLCLSNENHRPNTQVEWIPQILSQNVHNLVIDGIYSVAGFPIYYYLTDFISLTTLSLSLDCTIWFPAENQTLYQNLKTMLLIAPRHGKLVISGQFKITNQLSLTFPALEVLEMRGCTFQAEVFVEINVPQLITFIYEKLPEYQWYHIKIYGPKLSEFHYSSINARLFEFILDAPELHYAALEVNQVKETDVPRVCDLLKEASSLKHLKLSRAVATALVQCKDVYVIPAFDQLQRLELRCHPKELLELLQMMPCLESLKLEMLYWHMYKDVEPLTLCTVPYLKEVEFINFLGRTSQISFAKLFLVNAERLDRLTVYLGEKPHMTEIEIRRLLTEVKSMSGSCVISVK